MDEYLSLAKDVLKKIGVPYEGELEDLTKRIYNPDKPVMLVGSIEREIYELRRKIADGIKGGEDIKKLHEYSKELDDKIKYLEWD